MSDPVLENRVEQVQVDAKAPQPQVEIKSSQQPIVKAETLEEQPKSSKEWENFRQARAQERKQKEEAERRAKDKEAEAKALKDALEAVINKPSTNLPQNSTYQYEQETEDQIIEKKVQAALEIAERRRQQQRAQEEVASLPSKLNNNFKDFNTVCSTENLDYLDFHYPEVARAFKNLPDNYEKWSDIYSTVRRFVPNIDSKKDKQKADNNLQKPQSLASQQVTQATSQGSSHVLSEEKKAANWERMQRSMKGLS